MKLMYIWAVLKDDESFSRLSLHTHYKTSKIFSFFNSTTPSHTTCILSRKGLFQSFGVSLATRALPVLSYIGRAFNILLNMYLGRPSALKVGLLPDLTGIEPFLKFRARAQKKSQILMPSPKSRAIQLQLSSFLSRYVSEWAYFKVEGEIRVIDLVQGSGMIQSNA